MERGTLRSWLSAHTPQIVLAPSLVGTFVYVFLFTAWTLYISMTNSTLLPSYNFVGLEAYVKLWQNHRWQVAYTNLFIFGVLYVVGSMAFGLLLAILLDQRIRAESFWRTLVPLSACRLLRGDRHGLGVASSPVDRASRIFVHHLGWASFSFDWIINRNRAIYTIVITGFWQASGFCMVLFLAGLRSVDHDLIKAAQIDGASMARIYRKVILPAMRPISIAVMVVLLQYAIKTFDLVLALTGGGPGISTVVPAMIVYDFMFQRGLIAAGCRGRDHDPVRARRGAGALCPLADVAPESGGGPWLTPQSIPRPAGMIRSPRRVAGAAIARAFVVYLLLTAVCDLLPAAALRRYLQLVPHAARGRAQRPYRLPAQLFAAGRGSKAGTPSASAAPAKASSRTSTTR